MFEFDVIIVEESKALNIYLNTELQDVNDAAAVLQSTVNRLRGK